MENTMIEISFSIFMGMNEDISHNLIEESINDSLRMFINDEEKLLLDEVFKKASFNYSEFNHVLPDLLKIKIIEKIQDFLFQNNNLEGIDDEDIEITEIEYIK